MPVAKSRGNGRLLWRRMQFLYSLYLFVSCALSLLYGVRLHLTNDARQSVDS